MNGGKEPLIRRRPGTLGPTRTCTHTQATPEWKGMYRAFSPQAV